MSLRVFHAALASLAALALASTACTSDRPTGVVTGMTTQMQIPRDLKWVRVIAKTSAGALLFDQAYAVFNGSVTLPATLTFAPADGVGRGQAIVVAILGYVGEVESNDDGTRPVSGTTSTQPRLLRRAVLNYDEGRTAYLPLRLSYSCYGVQCSKVGETCVSGQCVSDAVDVKKLPTFVEGLYESTSANCFNAALCMPPELQFPARLAGLPVIGSTTPASAVDRCTFTIPDKDSSGRALRIPEGGSINVRVVFGRANEGDPSSLPRAEVLDIGPEGFTIPDPTKPGVFRLAEGLCNATSAASPNSLTTEVYVTPTKLCVDADCRTLPTCATKQATQSLCAADLAKTGPAGTGGPACEEKALKPAPSVLGLLVDRRNTMYGPLSSPAFSAVLGLPLGGTLLRETSVALAFTPPRSAGNTCASPALAALFSATTNFDETGANAARPILGFGWTRSGDAIAKFRTLQSYKDLIAGPPGVEPKNLDPAQYESFLAANPAAFDVALADGGFYGAVRARAAELATKRASLLVLGTREFAGSCGAALAIGAASRALSDATLPVATYVLALADSNPAFDRAEQETAAKALAAAGGTTAFVANTRNDGEDTLKGLEAMTTIAVSVATCSYVAPSNLGATTKLSYVDLAGKRVVLEPNSACAGGLGWRSDGGRVELCEQSCAAYREVVKTRGFVSAVAAAPLDEVPIVVRSSCND